MTAAGQDLSEIHGPIGELFAPEPGKGNGFSSSEVEFFEQHGYVRGGKVLSDVQVAALRTDLERFLDASHSGNPLWYEYHRNEAQSPHSVLFHALGAWRISEAFHDLLWNMQWLGKARQLLGAGVRFWHDQLFCKPPRDGGVVAWHQDYSYWTRTTPMAHLTCWIALDDATLENGCLHYVDGSHRWELLPSTGLAGDMDAIAAALSPQRRQRFQEAVPVELAAGECVFHHPLMVHGSFANRSQTSRRATVINMFADGVKSASDEELLRGVPVVRSGAKMEGQFFPLLLPCPGQAGA